MSKKNRSKRKKKKPSHHLEAREESLASLPPSDSPSTPGDEVRDLEAPARFTQSPEEGIAAPSESKDIRSEEAILSPLAASEMGSPEPEPLASSNIQTLESTLRRAERVRYDAQPLMNLCLRGLAFFYDLLVVLLVSTLIALFVGWRFLLQFLAPVGEDLGGFEPAMGKQYVAFAVCGILLTSWLYFSLVESLPTQGTLGKRLFFLKTVDHAGKRISFLRSNLRTLAKFASCATLGIGFLVALFRADKRALHDIVAETQVRRD